MPFRFLDLPPEIREDVYRLVLNSQAGKRHGPFAVVSAPTYHFGLSLLRVNRLISREATKIWQENVFIRIQNPWPRFTEFIKEEGKVPIVAQGLRAESFEGYHLHIEIDSPEHRHLQPNDDPVFVVTCLEDLPTFTRFWYHSHLNNEVALNPHLALRLLLRDPHVAERKLPRHLQEQLLLPFGQVKDLLSFSVEGEKLLPSVLNKLKELRARPEPSPADCLVSASRLKTEGDSHLQAEKYEEALDLYRQSFAAIHITVVGRQRYSYADAFFSGDDFTTGPFAGRSPGELRLVLRVQLVDKMVETYLKMEKFDDSYFWGRRTIVLFRASLKRFSISDDDFIDRDEQRYGLFPVYWEDSDLHRTDLVTGLPNSRAVDVLGSKKWKDVEALEKFWLECLGSIRFSGKAALARVFFNTSIASRALGKMADVRIMVRAAHVLLPNDDTILAEKVKLDIEADEHKRTQNEAVF